MSVDPQPLVSICMPTYNDGLYLSQSLESILRQTYDHLEILVADDGSTDNTEEIVKSAQDPRIRYHRNRVNLGQFENVNQTIQRARGKYIAIYHSDDVYEPAIVEKEVRFLEANPEAGVVFALDRRIDGQGRLLGETRLPEGVPANTCLGLADLMPILLRHKNRVLRAPTFMGRAEVFRQVGLFNTRDYDIAGDLEMWLRILTRFKIAILDEPLLWYRHDETQVSSRYDKLRTFEEHFFPIIDRYLAWDGLAHTVGSAALAEYSFHRCDDETFRAANLIICGKPGAARRLLQRPYPWRTLRTKNWRRRKLRVLLLRSVMKAGLAVHATGLLSRIIVRTEYGGHI